MMETYQLLTVIFSFSCHVDVVTFVSEKFVNFVINNWIIETEGVLIVQVMSYSVLAYI